MINLFLNRLDVVLATQFFQSWRPTSKLNKTFTLCFQSGSSPFSPCLYLWFIGFHLFFCSDPGLFVYCCDFSNTAVELVKVRRLQKWGHKVFPTSVTSWVVGRMNGWTLTLLSSDEWRLRPWPLLRLRSRHECFGGWLPHSWRKPWCYCSNLCLISPASWQVRTTLPPPPPPILLGKEIVFAKSFYCVSECRVRLAD